MLNLIAGAIPSQLWTPEVGGIVPVFLFVLGITFILMLTAFRSIVIGLPGVLRIRQGHWRVLYAVDDDRRAIWIEDVRRRRVHGGH